ncbi:CAP domain-containing protein [Leptothoe kymatousa]|uniref:SCP domain-containing protein n=1 Tax=Leptothoe kymatousa TAU-MAC 1615 TaxID=2364775 RepID=A0ABS5Y6M8_9CYAN|nr:CAP domain-containing protein [Leptothoe kymatousa]MBT9313153.1 hypothetical protein [Leptothoe kymatousa TAU-MAC 1615]
MGNSSMGFKHYAASTTLLPLLFSLTISPLSAQPINTEQIARSATVSTPDILNEINRLRQNPAAYADWLQTTRSYYIGTALYWPGQRPLQTQEGTTALDNAIRTLRNTAPLAPLTTSQGLSQAATDHAQDLHLSGRFSLRGSDGSTAEDRIQRYGTYEGRLKELISEGLNDPAAIVAALVLDDGNSSRSYQQTLLAPDLHHIGIGCIPSGRLTLCITSFATHYTDNAAPEPVASKATPTSSATEHLSTLAADFIAETNTLRRNPARYAEKLRALRPYYDGNLVKLPGQPILQTVEGVAALDEAIVALENTDSLPLLSYSTGLSQGAADHANDLGNGNVGHYGSDGSAPLDRVNRYGTIPAGNRIGENISFGPFSSAEWHIIQLLIDDNVPSRGHREALLRSEYRFTGSACNSHATFEIVCVATYATAYEE